MIRCVEAGTCPGEYLLHTSHRMKFVQKKPTNHSQWRKDGAGDYGSTPCGRLTRNDVQWTAELGQRGSLPQTPRIKSAIHVCT